MTIRLIDDVYLGTAKYDEGGGGATINNEDITITSNGEYTASSGYTGIGIATVNVPNPSTGTLSITNNGTYNVTDYASADVNVASGDTITATNVTGADITAGDKVWIDTNNGNYSLINFNNNYTKISSVSVTDEFVASNFSDSNYVSSNVVLKNFATTKYIVYFKIRTAGNLNSQQYVLAPNPFSNFNLVIGGYHVFCWSVANQDGYNIIEHISEGSEYWFKIIVDGTNRSASYSTNGTTYSSPVSYTDNAPNSDSFSAIIGMDLGDTGTYFQGSVFLKNFYITDENDNIVWRATSGVTSDTLMGYATENIANGSSGSVSTVLSSLNI